jgi:hypothetical protein
MEIQHIEDITRYNDSIEEVIDFNLYPLNKEMGYVTEIVTADEKKVITVNGKNKPIIDFI